jgi:hypothetical protein
MRASKILALSAFSLALCSATAWSEPKKAVTVGGAPPHPAAQPAPKPAGEKKVTVVDLPPIKGTPPPHAVDVGRVEGPKVALPELRKPLADRIAAAVEKDPF